MTDDHTPVADTFERSLRDLRISVTDRCNFRCTYCMPKEINREWESLGRDLLLSLEEIERLVRIFAELGVRKVRITGGEPLLRKNLEHLIVGLSAIDGIDDLALTTKGPLLVRRAAALETAGLNRVSVSLDSLDDTVFRAMNDVDSPVARVLDGISVAAEAGPGPVKINAVIQRGVNDHTIVDMVREFRGTGHILRFIEYMDVGGTNGRRLDDVVPAGEIIETVNEVYPLEVLASHYPGEVVRRCGRAHPTRRSQCGSGISGKAARTNTRNSARRGPRGPTQSGDELHRRMIPAAIRADRTASTLRSVPRECRR
ncbi:cyclic pyranopterin monophosphate synthase [bacterium BMS3Abin02]|nr:cyclic pyranopterin monophosphate synthase [bacterium BMS3Abin02]